MQMNQILGLAILAGGLLLLFLGYQSSQGVDDQVTEAVTGEYTDSTIWYWALGALGSAAGVGLLILGGRR
ncbi:MAG: DUF3185 family protein [Gammaproteobacteria bacterium]|nr:DUF3185 family protein [Gammaproteobacteria bacterium]